MHCKVVIFLVLCTYGTSSLAKKCSSFYNVKATIYTGSEVDPQEVVLKNGMADAENAYRIEIVDQVIPEICNGAIKGLKDLDTLVIKRCGVSKLEEGSIQDVPRLRIVDLSENSIKALEEGVFSNTNIRRLNLSSNSIKDIDPLAFDNMDQLQVLELSSNYIREINGKWFFSTPKLYRIEMDYNDLTSIPKDAFQHLTNSKSRDRNLDIWLSNNKINEIHPQAFKGIEKIETMWLSDNAIVHLKDETFKDVKSIHSLNLDDNKIVCLSDEFLMNLRVDEFNVDGNPLDCNCLRKIRNWGHKKNVELQTARRGLTCLRHKIDDVIKSQQDYYEEKLMDAKF